MRRTIEVNYPKRYKRPDHMECIKEPVRESDYDIMLKNFKLVNRKMPPTTVINYPKKRQRKGIQIVGVPEPVRVTIYDIMMKNFKLTNRRTFLHRIIYVGEHFAAKELDTVTNLFETIINEVNEDYCVEKLSGFLLVYLKYFVHVVEGCEDSLHKHLKLLFENERYMKNFGTLKLLICLSHINRRFHDDWCSYNGTPSKLLEEIDVDSNLEDTGRQIYSCIKKMYTFIPSFIDNKNDLMIRIARQSVPEAIPLMRESVTLSEDDSIPSARFSRATAISHLSMRSPSQVIAGSVAIDPYRNTLPENELLDFIIKTSFTQTLYSYYELYGNIPQRVIYKDRVWPIPSDFVPYDVFTKPYDCIVDLPKENEKENMASEQRKASAEKNE